ncbi:MAG TPA: SDR family oxidoreductase [Candidatus Angelobacter sp.]
MRKLPWPAPSSSAKCSSSLKKTPEIDDLVRERATPPMERPAQPDEVAPAFVFFASEADSSYITGEVLTLLGGETTAA